MDHLYDADAGPEFAADLLGDLGADSEDLEALLGADGEVGLVLVEADVDDLLFLGVHRNIIKREGISPTQVNTQAPHNICYFECSSTSTKFSRDASKPASTSRKPSMRPSPSGT